MQAHAVVFEDRNQVVFREIDVPEPTPLDVVVRTRYSWISNGTEGSFLRGERIAGDTPYRPGDRLPFPQVPGYQKTGVVEWVGADVQGVSVGDWVFNSVSRVGYGAVPMGGHVSLAVAPAEQIWRLPDAGHPLGGLDPITASGLVLTQVGYNCGARAPVSPGDWALVMGDGMVGHWSAQTLAWRGARVIMLGHHDWRLAHLRLPGAVAVNTLRDDPYEAVRRAAPSGLAVVVDTVGDVPTVESLLPFIRPRGHIVSAGFCGTEGLIDIQKLRNGEMTLHCPSGWTRQRMDDTLELLAQGKLETASLITQRLPASEVREAWRRIAEERHHIMGVVLEWNA